MEKKRLQELANIIKEDRDLFGEFDKAVENVMHVLNDMHGMHLSQTEYNKARKILESLQLYINNI